MSLFLFGAQYAPLVRFVQVRFSKKRLQNEREIKTTKGLVLDQDS
jgi:hypothetical protein